MTIIDLLCVHPWISTKDRELDLHSFYSCKHRYIAGFFKLSTKTLQIIIIYSSISGLQSYCHTTLLFLTIIYKTYQRIILTLFYKKEWPMYIQITSFSTGQILFCKIKTGSNKMFSEIAIKMLEFLTIRYAWLTWFLTDSRLSYENHLYSSHGCSLYSYEADYM